MVKRILILLFQISLFHCHIVLADGPKNYPEGKFYSSVKNHFLIATDKMKDEKFEKSVIVMLESSEEGAWGLAINKLLGEIPIALLIDPSLNTSNEREKLFKVNVPIFWGGPVDPKEIFILHSNEYKSESTKKFDTISITQDYKILFDIAEKKGPKKSLVILGYSGWGKGQLEGEMESDHWILSDIDLKIIFNEESKTKWDKAIKNSFIKI